MNFKKFSANSTAATRPDRTLRLFTNCTVVSLSSVVPLRGGRGDLCDADVSDFRKVDDSELAIARSQTPQLPPNFSVVYRCTADVGDRHQRLPCKGHTIVSRTSVTCEADDGELATTRPQTPQFPQALARFPA